MKRLAFTKRAIEALPPHDMDSPSREAEYTDMECIGLHLRVSKHGRKFFQHRYRHLGRKKCVTPGKFPHASLQEARRGRGSLVRTAKLERSEAAFGRRCATEVCYAHHPRRCFLQRPMGSASVVYGQDPESGPPQKKRQVSYSLFQSQSSAFTSRANFAWNFNQTLCSMIGKPA